MALNPKQRLFVKAYIAVRNATKAAEAAGYSKKTAGSQGHDLLKKPEIAEAIRIGIARHERILEQRAIENGVTKDKWLRELARIGFTNIDDLATIDAKGKVKITATDERDTNLGAVIKKISAGKFGPSIELHSKQAALETLGRSYGWVKDIVEGNNTNKNTNIDNSKPRVILTMPANGSEKPKG